MPKIKMLSGVKMIVHQSFDGYNLLIEARKLTKQKNVDREWIKLEK